MSIIDINGYLAELELDLELFQTHVIQKPMQRVKCASVRYV